MFTFSAIFFITLKKMAENVATEILVYSKTDLAQL